MGMEAWLTSAVADKEVYKAIVLAGSLHRVSTAKALAVLVTPTVPQNLRQRLKRVFNLVIPMEQEIPDGWSAEEFAKMEGLCLSAFTKCVYLSPNTMVLKNCDEIFDKYDKFAVCGEDYAKMDTSVYLFSPTLGGAHDFWVSDDPCEPIPNEKGDVSYVKGTRKFNKCFTDWIQDKIGNRERLHEGYNFKINLKGRNQRILDSTLGIVNFGDVHPLDLEQEVEINGLSGEWGLIEKAVFGVWRKIFLEDVNSPENLHSNLPLHLPTGAHKAEPIAIVGLSFRLPGGNNVEEFWNLLISGREAIQPLPVTRWTREHTQAPCQNRKVEAGFLSIPVDEFDAKFFGISGKEAEFLDPQIRLMHEIVWEALEDAMIDPLSLRGTKTGTFVGSWLQDYRDMQIGNTDVDFFRGYMGNSIAAGAARIAHFLETTGPSIATESGCSSAMVAVDMACKSLRNWSSNLALACGVNLLLKPFDQNILSFVVSPDGRCKTFDEGANGFGRAEGCAALVLKRLPDAIKDGNTIWGLIRGSAITQEGVSKSLGTPTVECESLAMEYALQDGQVDPADVSYLEAHGTGTPLGDPMEIAAITKAYSKGRKEALMIGSVKTNVGHTESVSGITGIIKVLLSMKNEKIPPHLNLKRLNPAINLEAIPAKIPLEAMSWPKKNDKPRIAGVSSFGISGTDGHVIIQEPFMRSLEEIFETDKPVRPLHIMKISAKSLESLQSLLETYGNIFSSKEGEDRFADLAYSANVGRATFNHRAVLIAKDFAEAKSVLENKSFKQAEVQSGGSQLCFLFTGQGSQYSNMGAALYNSSPIFWNEFNKCDQILTIRYGINLPEALWGPSKDGTELNRTLYSQTSIFCIEYCLLKLWESWGVKPDYVIGHSLGEFAAAVAAGVLGFEDALMLVAERSRLIDCLPQGKMLVIKADKVSVDSTIETYKLINSNFWVDYAALNSLDQTVVAGDTVMIENFAKFCEDNSLMTIVLAATHAFHSRHMDPMLEAYRNVARTVKPPSLKKNAPKYISGMDGKLIDLGLINAEYWVRHAREPVNFIDACKAAKSEGCLIYLELGPHPVLSAIALSNAENISITCLSSIRRNHGEWDNMLDSLAKLHLSNWKGQLDWKGFDRYYKRTRVSLPFYPFNRKPIWGDMEGSLPNIHPLLGKPVPTECSHIIFEKKVTLKNTSFTQDHVIGNSVIFPGAAFLEMCLAGGHAGVQAASISKDRMEPKRPVVLKSFTIASPLALYDSTICRIQTSTKLNADDNDEISYKVGVHRYVPPTSDGIGEWITHATANYLPVPVSPLKDNFTFIDIATIEHTWETVDTRGFYEMLLEVGFHFGPKFQSLALGWKSDKEMLLTVKIPEENDGNYLIHPIVGDAMIQANLMLIWTSKGNSSKMKLQVPVEIGEFMWFQSSTSPARYVYCSTNDDGKIDCTLLDGLGTPLARMRDVNFIETSVKLLEGMIQQHSTAMPKLWKEVWNSMPGTLQALYDITETRDMPFLQFSDQQKRDLQGINEIGEYETNFYVNLCNLTKLFFLKAMYELGWKPQLGVPFTLGELTKLLPNPKEHFKKYINFFLQSMVEVGDIVVAPGDESQYYFGRVPPLQEEINTGLEKVTGPEDLSRVEYQMIVETGKNLAQVWLGAVDPLQLLLPASSTYANASQFYNATVDWILPVWEQVNDVLFKEVIDSWCNTSTEMSKTHGSTTPVLRILEVGAGTGVFTEHILQYLMKWGKPFEFYFTDVSAKVFAVAEKRFENYLKHMTLRRFDMEEDPLAQGFCPKYFDVILACEVLHVAKDIRRTLHNLQTLLKPGGFFQIFETTMPDPRITHILGLTEGYWQFQDVDIRPYHATLTPDKWEQVLREIKCDKVVFNPVYNNVHSYITARLSPSLDHNSDPIVDSLQTPQHSWLILYNSSNENLAQVLKAKLSGVNRKVNIVQSPQICTEETVKQLMKSEFNSTLESVASIEGIVYLWGLPQQDGVVGRDQSQVSLPLINVVQTLMECKTAPRLYVVTQGVANVDGYDVTNPTAGTLHGIIKALTNEATELHLRCLDLSPDEAVIDQVDRIFYDFWVGNTGSSSIAFRNNNRLCAKLRSVKVNNNEPLDLPSACDRFQLRLPKTRMISDLEFTSRDKFILEDHEIEVQVKAMALNFRDVFAVLKPIIQFEDLNTIGLDFAGIVTKLGSKVTCRQVGDRVIGMNMDNNLSLPSHIKLEEECVVPLPTRLTFAEGVTLPAVFSTAFHCLINVAKMKRGDIMLIHTASGGVGLCAIQLAKLVGAEIIATAGSKRKQNYLRNLGIKHVFHSRTTEFGKQILEVTNGRGVDIVLNSITGEGFKEASLSALAKHGRFIEMSKLSVWKPEDVKELRPDAFYQIVDLTSFSGAEIKNVLKQLSEYLNDDNLHPIAYHRFDAVNIRGALNYLQKAKHIGKIVCMMPEVKIESSKLMATTPLFNELSTYLVTGGLGGIGFEVVKWMLSSGAKHIAIVSRSPPKLKIAKELESWNKNGKHVEAFPVDIGDMHQCRKLFDELKFPKSGFPQLRGVMHAAGVLEDATMENQTWDKFEHTYNPKVNGTWNLHDLTKDLLLEHFVLFSSTAASIGAPGQPNHSASNSFEDTLAAYRKSNGHPATSINWGNWGEVGVATEHDFPGVRPISTSQGILALETFLKAQETHLSVANFDSFSLAARVFPNLKHYLEDKRLFAELPATVIISSDNFWKEVNSRGDREEKLIIFKNFIKATLRNMLKMDNDEVIDDLAEFQTLGMDSLAMLEMKNALQNILGSEVTISIGLLKDSSNTDMLANRLLDSLLGEKEEGDSLQAVPPTMEELRILIRDDSLLPENISPSGDLMPIRELSGIKTVFIVGSTGVLGPYLLRDLSQRTSVKKIYCLVRKIGKLTPAKRLHERLQDVHLDDQVNWAKVECLQGDITDDRFGLSDEEYHRLAEEVDAVFNSAAIVDHSAKYYRAPEVKKMDVRNVNVKGTLRILEFAVKTKLKHVYHASSIYAIATTDENGCLTEDWEDVGAFDQVTFNMGYVLSKHISEQLCRQAVERGIPCKTFRHPLIAGDSQTGRCEYLTNHFTLRRLAFLKFGCMPDMPMPMLLMPVDHCTKISLDIFFNHGAYSDVYNVVHKDEGKEQIIIGIAKELGISIELISFSQFVAKLKKEKNNSPLALFMKIYQDEEVAILQNFGGNNPTHQAYRRYVEDGSNFFGSRKLPQLVDYYDALESTEMIMRRDIHFLKNSGVFAKFRIG